VDFTTDLRPLLLSEVDVDYEPARIVARVFTTAQCRRIVELGLGLGAASAEVGARDREVAEVAETRRSKTAWIPYGEETSWIYDRLARVAVDVNARYGFDLTGFTEDIQFTVYDEPGAFYDWHQDGLAGAVAVRKLSIVVQLSDPAGYEGADLEIFPIGLDALDPSWPTRARRQGGAIVFPAFEHHRVTPLVRGARHSLVCWVGGPPFR
jgi:PKHD-type hydroxylase